jgi:hypothetical protein
MAQLVVTVTEQVAAWASARDIRERYVQFNSRISVIVLRTHRSRDTRGAIVSFVHKLNVAAMWLRIMIEIPESRWCS